MELDADTLKEIINQCFDAVNTSKCGPILRDQDGEEVLAQLGRDVLICVLGQIIPKSMNCQHENIDPPEPWQQADED